MFPLWYLLAPYAVVVAVTGLFVFFNVYHIAKFGLQSVTSSIVIAAYTMSFIAVLMLSLSAISSYDWSTTVDLSTLLRFSISGDALKGL